MDHLLKEGVAQDFMSLPLNFYETSWNINNFFVYFDTVTKLFTGVVDTSNELLLVTL
jgi:hypothetical protein